MEMLIITWLVCIFINFILSVGVMTFAIRQEIALGTGVKASTLAGCILVLLFLTVLGPIGTVLGIIGIINCVLDGITLFKRD